MPKGAGNLWQNQQRQGVDELVGSRRRCGRHRLGKAYFYGFSVGPREINLQPNITGYWNQIEGGGHTAGGAAYNSVSGHNCSGIIATLSGSHQAFGFDASKSSALYSGVAVQPPAAYALIIIKA